MRPREGDISLGEGGGGRCPHTERALPGGRVVPAGAARGATARGWRRDRDAPAEPDCAGREAVQFEVDAEVEAAVAVGLHTWAGGDVGRQAGYSASAISRLDSDPSMDTRSVSHDRSPSFG